MPRFLAHRALWLIVAGLSLGLAAGAQTTTPTSTAAPNNIGQRKQDQQNRIANGIGSGQLNAAETQHLEKREAGLSGEARDMREDNGGKLSAADKTKLNRQYNGLSHNIYADKHNAATAHYGKGEIGQRRENQQDRIAQGARSGSLTARESARLEGQQRNLNRETRTMRATNGGHLSKAEKRAVNRQQNAASRNIYRAKHNGRVRRR